MRIGTKLLLGFIPLAILTGMVAEVLYINSKRINESSLLVKESYRTYADILEMRRHEKNFSFYREKFYLYRIKDTSGRAAESFSRLKRLAGKNEVASHFTKAEELLGEYQRITDLLLESEGTPEAEKYVPELETLGQQLEHVGRADDSACPGFPSRWQPRRPALTRRSLRSRPPSSGRFWPFISPASW